MFGVPRVGDRPGLRIHSAPEADWTCQRETLCSNGRAWQQHLCLRRHDLTPNTGVPVTALSTQSAIDPYTTAYPVFAGA